MIQGMSSELIPQGLWSLLFGMAGIFIVMGVIMLTTIVLNRLGKNAEE